MKTARLLDRIESAGNRLPNPTTLFIYMSLGVLAISLIASLGKVTAKHPSTDEVISAVNLLSEEGVRLILKNTVSNFVNFAPVGTVLVAILGIGIAEHSGLLGTALKASILKAPRKWLSFLVVLCGVLSSLAADTGYVVLIPLAAIIFEKAGRNPLTGIAAAFAGVSGGYSANFLIGPVDAILSGISTEAATLVSNYEVSAAGNYFFIATSTLFIAFICTLVTEFIVAPRLDQNSSPQQSPEIKLTTEEMRGLKAAGVFSAVFFALILSATLPAEGVFRNPETGSLINSPFIAGIVTLISLYAGVCGYLFGKYSGTYTGDDAIKGMEAQMSTMAGYLVLMFFAAQFVAYFQWSNLGVILAIKGAEVIQSAELATPLLLGGFVLLAAFINLFIGSASAKWALIAPIFVPMLMLSGISPEATQMAYRIGDSSTNIITPLMPYFGVVIAFAQRYRSDLGMGTMISMMLPYSIALLVSWSTLLIVWALFDLPLGPGSSVYY